jgi:hypothetical protein
MHIVDFQRGPLPDWDEVSEAAGNAEAFDYMDLSKFFENILAHLNIPINHRSIFSGITILHANGNSAV